MMDPPHLRLSLARSEGRELRKYQSYDPMMNFLLKIAGAGSPSCQARSRRSWSGARSDDNLEAGVEVDVYAGASIKRKAGILKSDAKAWAHLLTHRYRNPFCESCAKDEAFQIRTRSVPTTSQGVRRRDHIRRTNKVKN